jgi:hypothetical protein
MSSDPIHFAQTYWDAAAETYVRDFTGTSIGEARYLHQAYLRWRHKGTSHIRISARAAHAMIVGFICPRPVFLVSALSGNRSNMFPMNLLGSVSDGYFAFALDSTRLAAPLVARAGSVALSSIPHGTIRSSASARQEP